MIQVARKATIPDSSPAAIFATLSDTENLTDLLPRMRQIEVLEQHGTSARLAAYMAITDSVGTVRCEGDLHWTEPHEIVFHVQTPVTVETRWTLNSVPDGTEIHVFTALDLASALGPVAQIVPDATVEQVLADEIEQSLVNIARYCASSTENEEPKN